MAKPVGPICNLDCKYCFYLEKERLYPTGENFKMTDQALEAYVRQYIEGQDAPEISFAWQGGEPTLLGVKFFRKAVELDPKHAQALRNLVATLARMAQQFRDMNWVAVDRGAASVRRRGCNATNERRRRHLPPCHAVH